jgi:hypothetical protein
MINECFQVQGQPHLQFVIPIKKSPMIASRKIHTAKSLKSNGTTAYNSSIHGHSISTVRTLKSASTSISKQTLFSKFNSLPLLPPSLTPPKVFHFVPNDLIPPCASVQNSPGEQVPELVSNDPAFICAMREIKAILLEYSINAPIDHDKLFEIVSHPLWLWNGRVTLDLVRHCCPKAELE